jgi:hypothetical protein
MPSQTRRLKKQRGGNPEDVLRAQIVAIQEKEGEVKSTLQDVSERQLFDAINTAFMAPGDPEKIKANITLYTSSILKDNSTIRNLFPKYDGVPAEYVHLIEILGKYGKARTEMNRLIDLIYSYIVGLRKSYPTGDMTRELSANPIAGSTVRIEGAGPAVQPGINTAVNASLESNDPTAYGLPLLSRNDYNQKSVSPSGLPLLSRGNNNNNYNKLFKKNGSLPQLSSPTAYNREYTPASLRKSRRTRRLLRKKN